MLFARDVSCSIDRSRLWLLGSAALATALAVPGAASAQHVWGNGGVLIGVGLNDATSHAVGLEAAVTRYGDRSDACGVGGFLQFQVHFDGTVRFDLGGQANCYVAGAEAGIAWHSGSEDTDGGFGFHLAPFLSLGVVSAALRWHIPFSGGSRRRGTEMALNLGLRFPVELGGYGTQRWATGTPLFGGGDTVGRPLCAESGQVLASVTSDPSWSVKGPLVPYGTDLSRAQREFMAARWAQSALEEHASIAAFARLAMELMSLGAPSTLVERAHEAALDEVRHARESFAIASGYAGATLGPSALAVGQCGPRAVDLATLAVESLREGCLGEGSAAAWMRASAAQTDDATLRQKLYAMADDESRHADLGWAIVRWCESLGGVTVREALFAAAREIPSARAFERGDAALRGHGVLSGRQKEVLRARVRAGLLRAVGLPRGDGQNTIPRST